MACALGVTNALRRHRERVKEERLARQHGEMPPSVGGMADIPLFDRVVIAVADPSLLYAASCVAFAADEITLP